MNADHSQTTSSGDWLITSFARGYFRQLKRGQDMLQATQERHLVLTGRVLETQHQILAAVTAKPPTAPASRLRYGRVKDRIKDGFAKLEVRFTVTFDTIKKLYEFWRSPWGFFLGLLAWAAASYLGLVR
jgi:hypothetical protein